MLKRMALVLIAAAFSAHPVTAGEIISKGFETVAHRFFHRMLEKGFDCVRDYEACRANAKPEDSPPNLTPAQIEIVKRSFQDRTTQQTPPTIHVVPAGASGDR